MVESLFLRVDLFPQLAREKREKKKMDIYYSPTESLWLDSIQVYTLVCWYAKCEYSIRIIIINDWLILHSFFMCDYFLIFKCFPNQKKNLTKALNVIIFLPSPPKIKFVHPHRHSIALPKMTSQSYSIVAKNIQKSRWFFGYFLAKTIPSILEWKYNRKRNRKQNDSSGGNFSDCI
jgi:hypothetical protein